MAKKQPKPDPEYRSQVDIYREIQKLLLRDVSYEFELFSKLISKKNLYHPGSNGKSFFKPKKITDAERTIDLQIPDELRGLKLEHPHVMIECHIPKKSWRSDRDNGWTFLSDCLVKAGVLADDSISRFNGYLIMIPVLEASEYKTKVRIWKNV